MSDFDLKKIKDSILKKKEYPEEYQKQLDRLKKEDKDSNKIKDVVNRSIKNIDDGKTRFVIYGDPQSGKTEMMIALTAKLIDKGRKIIIVLLNDNVKLLHQNLDRFQRSGLAPTAENFSEILPSSVRIGNTSRIIFCKKNSKDLQKLIDKLRGHNNRVIIDDEADYATPNSKINTNKTSKIYELTRALLGTDGIYIGVTATPARLNLNNTHNNQAEYWIYFNSHSKYTGPSKFFPSGDRDPEFILTYLEEEKDDSVNLREALFRFMVNVAYLNTREGEKEDNYSFLIHTSGKIDDHSVNYRTIEKTLGSLQNGSDRDHEDYFKSIFKIAEKKYPDYADKIIKYIIINCNKRKVVVMNSDKESSNNDSEAATNPATPFTIVIGGNIVSRGVTFDNLLSMFFTRDVKHKIQQDTYIQRARMFGSRNEHLKYFELTIPEKLYRDWHQCFFFHQISRNSIRSGNGCPVWLENKRISAVASSSIDKANVSLSRGEMSFELFDYSPEVEEKISQILEEKILNLEKLNKLSNLIKGKNIFPKHLIEHIEQNKDNDSIAIHEPKKISYGDDIKNLVRARKFIGRRDLRLEKYPNAVHHIYIIYNQSKKARFLYKPHLSNIKFLQRKSRKEDN